MFSLIPNSGNISYLLLAQSETALANISILGIRIPYKKLHEHIFNTALLSIDSNLKYTLSVIF